MSRRVQITRGGFFQQTSVSASSNQPFAVDLFTKYSAHGLDVGADHAWVDDTGLYVWILCFRIGDLGVHMDSCEAGELRYTCTAGVHGAGAIGWSGSFLTLPTSSCRMRAHAFQPCPWTLPVPEQGWTTELFIFFDLGVHRAQTRLQFWDGVKF